MRARPFGLLFFDERRAGAVDRELVARAGLRLRWVLVDFVELAADFVERVDFVERALAFVERAPDFVERVLAFPLELAFAEPRVLAFLRVLAAELLPDAFSLPA